MFKTVEELRAAYPDLTAQIENAARDEARAQGAADERARLQAIESIRNGIGNEELVRNAMFGEKPMTAEQLALQAIQENAAKGAAVLNGMAADTTPANAVVPQAVVVEQPAADPDADLKNDLEAIKNVIQH